MLCTPFSFLTVTQSPNFFKYLIEYTNLIQFNEKIEKGNLT